MSILSKNKEKIVGLLSVFLPWIKPAAALVGIGASAVVVSGNTIEEKLVAIAVALATSAVHKAVYYVKDLLDNGKLDGSAPKG